MILLIELVETPMDVFLTLMAGIASVIPVYILKIITPKEVSGKRSIWKKKPKKAEK